MKKKLAILFASLSLCACGFIACENEEEDNNDTNEKLAIGAECVKNDACESGFCQMDGDKGACAAKIANDAECKNANDLCAGAGYECKADPDDGILRCTKDKNDEQKAGKGQACGGSIECDGDNLYCDGICKLKANEICEAGDACVTGYECKAGEGSDADLKCRLIGGDVQKVGKGQACGGSIECDGDNLQCDGICKLKADEICEAGDACVTGYECKAGEGTDTDLKCREIGGGVISDKAGKGELCGTSANNKKCDDGLLCQKRGGEVNADDMICKIKVGGDCSATGDAVYCVNGSSCKESGSQKTCEKPAELNDECVVATGCGGTLYCAASGNASNGVCQNKLSNGDVCFQDNIGDNPGIRNERCLSGHCEGKRVAGSNIPNDFEWKCADKIAADAPCTRLLTDDGITFIYTSICADDDRICRPETYFEGNYGYDWVEGKCLPELLKLNETCNTPREDITLETECDWGWGRHLICHDTGNGNLCKIANGGDCSMDEYCASGHCEKTGTSTYGTCKDASN